MGYEGNNPSKLELREQLQRMQQQVNFTPAPDAAFQLALSMMEHLGDSDPVLRDELIYSTLQSWITEGGFQPQQLRQLLSIAIADDHLFYRIGEEKTNSVFVRSFSALILPLILWADRQVSFLDDSDIRTIVYKLTDYINREIDLRGYTGETGWAHAVAHAADAVEDVVQSMYIRPEDLSGFLEAFKSQLRQTQYPFIYEEDERMVSAVVTLLNRNLLEDKEILRWIADLGDTPKVGDPLVDLVSMTNIKNFLRSLYFRLLPNEGIARFIDPILMALNGKLFRS
ncbi:DUF2785 domain-containing protein [Paenibacillus sp. MBLB2552]|uniref:DUF2785 domain-containing protein n=1 Tax=Paenibacillus mellifer TaxID=2937794 RepID=A0A9X2BP38_9BACL|nr:DUF2785 domain-containing protein [Paenibacillus mellifer]MCK8487579.1 DUF2785 domain-containing protein [Paenibacillus mellifer]